MFDAQDYNIIYDIVFKDEYPGYKPNTIESPNGNNKWDEGKRYAHIAKKYLDYYDSPNKGILVDYLQQACNTAINIATELGIPKKYVPTYEHSALRILEYDKYALSNPHKDFNLFTLMCYRNIPECFKYTEPQDQLNYLLLKANKLNKQIHFGEMLEIINPVFKATTHEVIQDPQGRTQYSIVFFAIPHHGVYLQHMETVGEWLDERLSRSRKDILSN